jgi:hypothetical protein
MTICPLLLSTPARHPSISPTLLLPPIILSSTSLALPLSRSIDLCTLLHTITLLPPSIYHINTTSLYEYPPTLIPNTYRHSYPIPSSFLLHSQPTVHPSRHPFPLLPHPLISLPSSVHHSTSARAFLPHPSVTQPSHINLRHNPPPPASSNHSTSTSCPSLLNNTSLLHGASANPPFS